MKKAQFSIFVVFNVIFRGPNFVQRAIVVALDAEERWEVMVRFLGWIQLYILTVTSAKKSIFL